MRLGRVTLSIYRARDAGKLSERLEIESVAVVVAGGRFVWSALVT